VSRLLPLEPSDKVALRFGPPGRTVELTYRELIGVAGALVPRIVGCARVAVHATPTIHTAVGAWPGNAKNVMSGSVPVLMLRCA
jgi:malonyl-CoA/methylmalonyl-CoA synthetase